jgi:hypothetical protein
VQKSIVYGICGLWDEDWKYRTDSHCDARQPASNVALFDLLRFPSVLAKADMLRKRITVDSARATQSLALALFVQRPRLEPCKQLRLHHGHGAFP